MQEQRNKTEIEFAFAGLYKGESGSHPNSTVQDRQEDDMELFYSLIEAVPRRCVPDELYDPILNATMDKWMKTLEEGEGVPAEIILHDTQVIVEAFDYIQKQNG